MVLSPVSSLHGSTMAVRGPSARYKITPRRRRSRFSPSLRRALSRRMGDNQWAFPNGLRIVRVWCCLFFFRCCDLLVFLRLQASTRSLVSLPVSWSRWNNLRLCGIMSRSILRVLPRIQNCLAAAGTMLVGTSQLCDRAPAVPKARPRRPPGSGRSGSARDLVDTTFRNHRQGRTHKLLGYVWLRPSIHVATKAKRRFGLRRPRPFGNNQDHLWTFQ